MSKRPVREYEWEIVGIKSSRAEHYGRVSALDADSAIKRAIIEFEVAEPWRQK